MGKQWLHVKITNKKWVVIGTSDDEDSFRRKNEAKAMVEILERNGILGKTQSVPGGKYNKPYIKILAKGKNIPQIKKYTTNTSPSFR